MSEAAFDSPTADVVVVGAGIAGALIAYELARNGIKVQILEAGPRLNREDVVERYRSSWRRDLNAPYPSPPHAPAPDPLSPGAFLRSAGPDRFEGLYVRAAGGTTWHWTGITPRFLPADFELRSRYGAGDDWPIRYADLEPYYLHAERALGVAGDSRDDHGSARSGPYPMPAIAMPYADRLIARRLAPHGITFKVFPAARNSRPYDGRPACCGSNSCSPICPTGAQYSADTHVRKAEAAGARLTTDATAFDLDMDVERRITAVRYKDPAGGVHRVPGRVFVLACNGIETPRLLLMSRSERNPEGVANNRGQVGRYLMGHPMVTSSFLMPEPIWGGRGPQAVSGITSFRDGEFRRRHAASKWALTNSPDLHAYCVALIERKRDWAGIRNRLRSYASRAAGLGIEFEDLPEAANRITLSAHRRDAMGLPAPDVHYRLGEYVKAAVREAEAFHDRLLGWLGAEKLASTAAGEAWPHHIMGTTRMGNDPRTSVVDRDCRAHDFPNLYVAGSGVFTTSGTANPTLLIAALVLRLGNTLRERLRRGEL